MTREAIFSVVAKHLHRAVEEIEPAELDGALSMKDYGANSIDIVEVVSASMRELRVRVPRSALGEIKTIDGLVDLLHKAAQESAS